MKNKRIIASLICCLILLGSCSRPAVDAPADAADPAPVVSEQTETTPPADGEDEDADNNDDTDEDEQQPDEEEQADDNEQEDDNSDPSADASSGCYKLFDSGFEVNVQDPFVTYYDPLANNMTVTIKDDPSCRGYIFYDTSEQSMDQLEATVKSLEDSVSADPTVTDLKTDVDKQEDGLFAFTFTYAAGATEGSPAGFYFIRYQKTEGGVINVNLFTERKSNSDAVMKLIESIKPAGENAVEYNS